MSTNDPTFWTKQATKTFEQWTQAQQQALRQWSLWMAGTPPAEEEPAPAAPYTNGAAAPPSEPGASDMYQRMLMGQTALMRLMGAVAEAWTKVAPRVEAGDDVGNTLRRQAEALRDQVLGQEQEMAESMEQAQALWAAYAEQFRLLGRPWFEAWAQSAQPPSEHPPQGWGPFVATFDVLNNAYDQSVGALLDTPSLGLTRELNDLLAQTAGAVQEVGRAYTVYRVVVGDLWTQAFEGTLHKLAERTEAGEPVPSPRELGRVWTDVADGVFIEGFASEPYLKAQQDLLRASMTLRLRQRELTELMQQALDLPTRSEVDESFKLIYTLRKRTKALEKQVRARDAALDALRADVADLKAALGQAPAGVPANEAEAPAAPAPQAAPEKAPKAGSEAPDYASRTKEDLYAEAQERDIPGRSSMTKADLIRALQERD